MRHELAWTAADVCEQGVREADRVLEGGGAGAELPHRESCLNTLLELGLNCGQEQ